MAKKMMLIFERTFERVHLYKDVGMIPAYFKKILGVDSEIVFYRSVENESLSEYENEVKMTALKKRIAGTVPFLGVLFNAVTGYLLSGGKKADMLMLFHLKHRNFFYRWLYKSVNPEGKTYLKLDMNAFNLAALENMAGTESWKGFINEAKKGFLGLFKAVKKNIEIRLIRRGLAGFDMISVETRAVYDGLTKIIRPENLAYIPNGFDSKNSEVPGILPFEKKENIILAAGRVGSPEKNSMLLLRALAGIDLKDWKAVFAGPVEPAFMAEAELFIGQNPALTGRVEFTGNIGDRKSLYSLYNRAKIFCLTSDYESFGMVLVEALFFGGYIISTGVGAAYDITCGGKFGTLVKPGDADALARALKRVISGEEELSGIHGEALKFAAENFTWKNIVTRAFGGFL